MFHSASAPFSNLAYSITSLRPYKWVSCNYLKADLASSFVKNSTKPKPLWFAELAFLGSLTFLRLPYDLNSSLISSAVHSNAKFFTNSFELVTSSLSTFDSYVSAWVRFFNTFDFCFSYSAYVTALVLRESFKAWSSIIWFYNYLTTFSASYWDSTSIKP